MPPTRLLAPHDDGRMYQAELLDQYRGRDGSWRVVVSYSTEPGSRYIRAEPADRCRPLPEPQDDQPHHAQARREQADRQDDPAG